MSAQLPTAQRDVGHIPSDLIPHGADPRTVVVVQHAPRSYRGSAVVVVLATLGAALVVYMLLILVQATAGAADELAKVAGALGGVGVGGLTLKIVKGGK